MERITRIAILALALAAILGGIVGNANEAAAANGYEQWVMDSEGRCLLFWDGYNYTLAGCPGSHGGVDAYYWGGTQWVYLFSSGPLSDGGTWFYYQGITYYDTVSNTFVNGIYPTQATLGAATWEGLTNNAVANQFFIGARTDGGTWTTPTCIYTYQGICVI